jgi:hypothetical protein
LKEIVEVAGTGYDRVEFIRDQTEANKICLSLEQYAPNASSKVAAAGSSMTSKWW